MSDLHLTDAQLPELATLGPLGEEAAHELKLWRAVVDDFDYITCNSLSKAIESHELYGATHPLAAAIIHARDTAELRAALTFHTLMLPRYHSYHGGDEYSASQKAINAIAAALKERQT